MPLGLLIFLHEGGEEGEEAEVGVGGEVGGVVEVGVVEGEVVAVFLLEEDAGDAFFGKGVVVAVGGQLAEAEAVEVVLLAVEFLYEAEAASAGLADLAVLHGVVVANHVEVDDVAYLAEWHERVLDKIGRADEARLFARHMEEDDVVLGLVLEVVLRQGDEGCCAGGVVVHAGVVERGAEVAEVVVMGQEEEAAVVLASRDGDHDVVALIVGEELRIDMYVNLFRIFWEVGRAPHDGLVAHLLSVGFVELERRGPGADDAAEGQLHPFAHLAELGELAAAPEVDNGVGAFPFGLAELLRDSLEIVVVGIDIIEAVVAFGGAGELAHDEVRARFELAAVNAHAHLAGEGVDVLLKRLQHRRGCADKAVLLHDVSLGFADAVAHISASLHLRCGKVFDNLSVVVHILRVERGGGSHEEEQERDGKAAFHIIVFFII